MNPQIEDLVDEYKNKLSAAGAKIFLVYAYKEPFTDENVCKISSNADKQGIRAILHAILMPTKEALALVAQALYASASASTSTMQSAIDKAQTDGAFLTAAKSLFEHLRPYWTIKGWENDKPQTPS
jgi:hypothetical protein